MKRFLVCLSFIICHLSFSSVAAQNPYLPLWEHLPDGEPRVFEDPDNPGKYRAYIIGSHSDDPNVQAQVSAAIATQDVNTIVGTVSSISGTLPPIIVDTKGQSDLAKLAAGASGAAGANTTGEAPAPAADTAQHAADAAQPAEAPAQ